jgi:RNA polymerase sigma-70 factor (ECF subfamily)
MTDEPIDEAEAEHGRDEHDRGRVAGATGPDPVLRRERTGSVLRTERARGLLPAAADHHVGDVRMPVNAAPLDWPRRQPATPEPMWADVHDRLHAFVARRVPANIAEDLAQETLLRLVRQIGRLRERDRLDAWAYQVARNVIADYWRNPAAVRELPFDPALDERVASPPDFESLEPADRLRSEIASCLTPMVERLADPYREAIRLTDLGTRTQAGAAAELGLSVPGMKARVQRARAQLRELLHACCRIELDRRGQITDLQPRGPDCGAGAGGSRCGCSDSRD